MTVKEMAEQLSKSLEKVFQAVPKGKRTALFHDMCCIESWAYRGIAASKLAEREPEEDKPQE